MSGPRLVDTHCHLNLGELARDPLGVFDRARAAGVEAVIVIGIDVETSVAAAELASGTEGIYAAVGIHPTATARAEPSDLERIEELLDSRRVVAIGESGLDLYWDDSPEAVQRQWLERHCELALRRDLPLVLHIRDAYPLAARVLEPFALRGLRGVVHCFGGQAAEVEPFLDWRWPISYSGILTYSKAENVRAAAERTPLAQCLVETDAPWLTPASQRGQTNEPAFVVHTAQRLAEVKAVSYEEIARVTTANARRVFALGETDKIG